ncbi:hypothetical protein [Arthrobacter woluwensis]|uniref:hypothetical protein n=1 Tax=Arthrobacter woluwensis TaxID=156980 RepID=UPI0037F553B2
METTSTLALGIELHLSTTGDGGRATSVTKGLSEAHRFKYRPNWGLPGWAVGEQAGAPVLAFSRSEVVPGHTVHAVIVPLAADKVPDWFKLAPGDLLRLYEGPRICGHATVTWVEASTWPMPSEAQDRFVQRLRHDS